MKRDTVIDIAVNLQGAAEYHDGLATVPAYLLEQLFLEVGIEHEHYYTEPEAGQ